VSGKKQNSIRVQPKMARAITALLACHTIEEASQSVGIPTSTLRRWRSKPAFAAALLAAQEEIFLAVGNEIRGLAMDAAQTLGAIVRDEKQPAPSRVRASLAVLTLLLKTHEHEVLESRITKLEAARRKRNADQRFRATP
jgi:hypothetical protein